MADTRRQLFKSSVLSALGVLSFATVVKAAGSKGTPQDSILLRVDNNTTYLFETRADGNVHVFEVTPSIATAAPLLDVDGSVYDGKHQLKKRMSKISFGAHTINVQNGVVTDDPPLGGLTMSRAQWAEISTARVGKHNPP
jgi:hypothetical protein